MAVRDATDGVGSRQGVLSGVFVAALGDKVEGGVRLRGGKEVAVEFTGYDVRAGGPWECIGGGSTETLKPHILAKQLLPRPLRNIPVFTNGREQRPSSHSEFARGLPSSIGRPQRIPQVWHVYWPQGILSGVLCG